MRLDLDCSRKLLRGDSGGSLTIGSGTDLASTFRYLVPAEHPIGPYKTLVHVPAPACCILTIIRGMLCVCRHSLGSMMLGPTYTTLFSPLTQRFPLMTSCSLDLVGRQLQLPLCPLSFPSLLSQSLLLLNTSLNPENSSL